VSIGYCQPFHVASPPKHASYQSTRWIWQPFWYSGLWNLRTHSQNWYYIPCFRLTLNTRLQIHYRRFSHSYSTFLLSSFVDSCQLCWPKD
jgi:hypothetical protein